MISNPNRTKAFYMWHATGNGLIACKLMIALDRNYMTNGISTLIVPDTGPGVNILSEHLTDTGSNFISNIFKTPEKLEYETVKQISPVFKGVEIIGSYVKYKGLYFTNNNYKSTIKLVKVLYDTKHVYININMSQRVMKLYIDKYSQHIGVIQCVKK